MSNTEVKETQKKIKPFCVSCGKTLAHTYKRVYDEKRKKMVVKKDSDFDIKEFVLSCNNATDLAMLKERCIKLGEVPSVNPDIQFGIDETVFPSDIHELNATLQLAKKTFEGFPPEIQAAFGNSYENYMNSVIAGSSAQTIAAYQQKIKEEAAKAAEGDK